MARIYTRTGDTGETSLFDGTRTLKANMRVDLYGDVDELNSWLGYCAALVDCAAGQAGKSVADGLERLVTDLHKLQTDLLQMGAILADPGRSARQAAAGSETLPFSPEPIEKLIDRLDADLPRLHAFILPGGHQAAAAFHLARTVCRRVERRAVAMAAREPLPTGILATLNRLSDFLFVAGRWTDHALGGTDLTWAGGQDVSGSSSP